MATERSEQDAERALQVALSQHCNGQLSTLAWVSAGMPDTGIGPDDITFYQEARQIVHDNGGKLKDGDVGRLLKAIRKEGQ